MKKYGRWEAEPDDTCFNSGHGARFTTPCCYADFEGELTACPECGAPIECEIEMQPQSVCRIRREDDD